VTAWSFSLKAELLRENDNAGTIPWSCADPCIHAPASVQPMVACQLSHMQHSMRHLVSKPLLPPSSTTPAASPLPLTGFDMVATAAEEARNPLRDIPIASVASVVITGAMYVLMATAIVGERLILVDTRQEEEEGGRGKGELGGGGGQLWQLSSLYTVLCCSLDPCESLLSCAGHHHHCVICGCSSFVGLLSGCHSSPTLT
jgi:hypothetical protein